ncbi:MAG: hypothetical protein IJT75_09990 [Bacteroidaceae bacterium]|nr:hypothetical protein [Bacteroidaceae bacterium]
MRQSIFFVMSTLLCVCSSWTAVAQDATQKTLTLLSTKDEGPWPCAYYFLDSNEELSGLTVKDWAGVCADETDWVQGWGPFSSEHDHFLYTHWGSPRQALLVRRHFTLTAAEAEAVRAGKVTFRCSYDENPKAYLNGTAFWWASGWNDNAYAASTLSSRHRKLLREGDNVIAISLTSGGGSGHLDMELTATITVTPDGVQTPQTESPQGSQPLFRLDGTPAHPRTPHPKGVYVQKDTKHLHR